MTGQSIAFEMLIEGLNGRRSFDVVDLAERRARRDAQFSAQRALSMLGILQRVWSKLGDSDIIYLQIAQSRWGFIRDAMVILAARLRGCRIVAHLHGGGYPEFYNSLSPIARAIIRSALWKIDRLIVLSEGLRSNFAFMGEAFFERLRVVPNAAPIPWGRPKPAPTHEICLLYLSNLLVEKGYFDCIDALPHITRTLPDAKVKLLLAGAFMLGADDFDSVKSMQTETEKRIRYMNLENQVEILGVVDRTEKIALLDRAHLLLLPSYYRNEGQPISVIESLTRGTPAIVTAWRGIADILGEFECGALVPAASPIAIAEAVIAFYRDPDRYEQASSNALRRSKEFSIETYVSNLITVFDEARRR
ncbi:MAG: glycosyltransferase family 4 protein [Alphaproteobacteria bacterium]